MKRSEIFFGLLRIPIDIIAAMGALLAAYFLRANEELFVDLLKRPDLGSFPTFDEYITLSFWGVGLFILILAFFGLYSLRGSDSYSAEFRKIFAASLIWLMATITYYFFIREFPFSRLVLFYSATFLFIFTSLGRLAIKIIQRSLVRRGIGVRRVVLVGGNSLSQELKILLSEMNGFELVGHVEGEESLRDFFGTRQKVVEEVIQTNNDHLQATRLIAFCREHHLQYHFVPDLLELHRTNIEISGFGGIPLISLRPVSLDGWGKVIKRIFDFVASALGLIILSPLFLLIAVAIRIDSKGTIFFQYLDDGRRAERVGERGKTFHCWKFRTMKMGTHAMRYNELSHKNIRKDSPLVKIQDDPRVTRVGKLLRRFSFDELPQLWNVLKGDMSLVGPRPHLPEEVARYQQHHKFVLAIKPGITGMAQISGRSDLPFDEEVRLDTFYIENWSLLLDLKILLKTVGVVFQRYKE